MAKSMHELMEAFNEGMSIMEKAKKKDAEAIQLEDAERDKTRQEKMQKVGSGMASLEALTSKLKMSFNDDATQEESKV
jgi:lipocalin